MWSDNVKDQYWWMNAQNKIEELLRELSKAEDEECADLYLCHLHLVNEAELSFFTEVEKEEIKGLLSILIEDSEKHCNLLVKISVGLKQLLDKHTGEHNAQKAL